MELLIVIGVLVAGFIVYASYRGWQVYREDQPVKLLDPATKPVPFPMQAVSDSMARMGSSMAAMGGSMAKVGEDFTKWAAVLPKYDLVRTSTHWQWHAVGFNKHDVWVGLYWKFEELFENQDGDFDKLTLYFCPLPCVLISFARVRGYKLIPRADKRIDPVCTYCGEVNSVHPVDLGGEACTGKY